jgi:hypothetical protein
MAGDTLAGLPGRRPLRSVGSGRAARATLVAVQTTERAAPRRLTRGRVALGVLVLAMVGMWVYVLLPGSAQAPVNRLNSLDFGRAGEPICAQAVGAIDALPKADTVTTAAERAVLVRRADGYLSQMLDGLAAVAPDSGEDARSASRWLADWHTYLGDREAWASRLAGGEDSQFLETMAEGGPISASIDDFANANEMSSCTTPYDV